MTNLNRRRLGILVGGGPAPGINSAISAATIEARKEDISVLGILDGYEHLIRGRTDMVRELSIEDVSRIHHQGGSIIRTSRENPTRSPAALDAVVEALTKLNITHLMTIGGDDTAFAAASIARRAAGRLRVAHVPKTIDNDLPLPSNMPTFGYETARSVGTDLVLTMMEDSRTTRRWFVIVVMGRKAGHLAMGIGKAAGATLTIVPEEFSQSRISLEHISRIIEGAIIKRRLNGQAYGLAVVAEGVAEKLDPEELKGEAGVEVSYDPYGHISLADIPLAALIKQRIQRRFAERNDNMRVTEVTLGYELRCAPPIPFDIEYTRTLGYGAVRFLLNGSEDKRLQFGGFVCLDDGNLRALPFEDVQDAETGKTAIRLLDPESDNYRVAQDYMIRLSPDDLEDTVMCARLAAAAHLSPEQFKEDFGLAFEGHGRSGREILI